ncbi:TolC family protein [Maribacter sp.]|uniref:TolC family protein n=1 Tax=Maribacter sp. TaxID=1897614 RepID=UPI0025B923C5|nr:TolC family protein [Maribacter sp.]
MRNTTNIYVHVLLFACFTVQFICAQEKPLNLEEVKALALNNNKEIIREQYNLDAANTAQKGAKTLGKPSLEASAYGIYMKKYPLGLLPDYTLFSTLGVSQVLYAGGRINKAKKLASSAVDLQTLQKKRTQNDVLLNVETTYWQLVNVKGKVELAQKYQTLLNKLLIDITNLYDAGLTYKNNLLEVQVEANQAELNLTIGKDNLLMLKLRLAQLMGMKNTDFDVDGTISDEAQLIQETLVASAIENRPEIAMLKNVVEMSNLQADLLKAERKPTLGISFMESYMYGDNLNATESKDHLTSFVGLASLHIPIFDWGGRKHRVKEQQFKVEAQKVELEHTKELVAIEIQNAYLELNQAIKRVEIAKKSLEQSDENLKLHQDRFDAGTVNGSDVLEAQVLWQHAFSDLIDANANYNIRKANYIKAIGEQNI